MGHSDFPVKQPIITDVLARSIHAEMLAEPPKAFAYPTWFRHSDAGRCGRYLWFEHNNYEVSNPIDVSSAWVMWLGKLLHEELQRCLPERYPDAKIEYKLHHEDLSSGHADALIDDPVYGRILFELKTKNSTQFSKAVGWNKAKWSTVMPQGPDSSTRLQGALNATAVDASLLVIGIIGMEAASKGFAEKIGLDDISRSVAEWHFGKSEFGPWANQEMERLERIKVQLQAGVIPDKQAVGDELELVKVNPFKPDWNCQYCSHWDNCKEGPK